MDSKIIINSVINLPNEIWIQANFNEKLMISNYGRISYKNHCRTSIILIDLLKYSLTSCGKYLTVQPYHSITKKRKPYMVHRLVAIHFIPNPNNLPEVNHIDGNRYNNHVDNLEWVSGLDNIKHAKANKLQPISNGLPRPIIQMDLNDNVIRKFKSITEAGKLLNCKPDRIRCVVDGITNTYKGYKWTIDINTEPSYSNGVNNSDGVKILQLDLNNDIIKTHTSIKSAARELNIQPKCIRNVLNGVQKTTGGFKWKKLNTQS